MRRDVDASRRPSTPGSGRVLRGLVLAATVLATSACASVPLQPASWRGARLYAEGTRALDRGDVAAAVSDLEGAAALVPQASEVQNHLGLAYAAAGRPEDARRAFERALELDCGNAAARHNLRVADRAR